MKSYVKKIAKRKKLITYASKDGWRWKLVSNGRIMADSSEAYVSRWHADRALKRVVKLMGSLR